VEEERPTGLQIAANRRGSVCNALFHETTVQLIRCKFMKHRFVSPMRTAAWNRERRSDCPVFLCKTHGNSRRCFVKIDGTTFLYVSFFIWFDLINKRKIIERKQNSGLKGHQKNADVKEASCGNEPGDGVPDTMRNSQDGSFYYSGRSEVSLPQVDLELSRRDHRLSSDGRM